MKKRTKKKSLLTLALGIMPMAIRLMVSGKIIQGGILWTISIILILAYDQLDDQFKMPEGIDTEALIQISDLGADAVKALSERINEQDTNA